MELGIELGRKGAWDEAIVAFDKVLRDNPTNELAYVYRGTAFFTKGDLGSAIIDFTEAIRLNPTNDMSYCNRASIFCLKEDFDRAMDDIEQSLRLNPTNHFAYMYRANVNKRKGKFEKAIQDCNEVQRLNPTNRATYMMRGYCFRKLGNFEVAVREYQKARRLNPRDVEAINELAWLLATCPSKSVRDGRQAVKLATQACDLDSWNTSEYIDTLAAAYAEAGKFEQAEKYEQQALAKPGVDDTRRAEMGLRLALYKLRQPYRENNVSRKLD
jgi:tetratricopeptide (TPR) repeat protein